MKGSLSVFVRNSQKQVKGPELFSFYFYGSTQEDTGFVITLVVGANLLLVYYTIYDSVK